MALEVGWRTDVGDQRVFARMLDIDENRLAVGRLHNAGDLAPLGTDQEAAQARRTRLLADESRDSLVGVRVGRYCQIHHRLAPAVANLPGYRRQHHAVGDIGIGAIVSLYPQQARCLLAEPGAIRAGKIV